MGEWDERPEIDDPDDKKPDGYDDIPKTIVDPAAKKPDDWDDESDGEWEAPTIDNREYKGEWKPKRITNKAYKGKWEPLISTTRISWTIPNSMLWSRTMALWGLSSGR